MRAGAYDAVSAAIADVAMPGLTLLILARSNTPELELFLGDIAEALARRGYRFGTGRDRVGVTGGVAAYIGDTGLGDVVVPGTEPGDVSNSQADIAVVVLPGAAASHTVLNRLEPVSSHSVTGRTIISLNRVAPRGELKAAAMRHGLPDDLEHVSVADSRGRTVHLAPDSDKHGALVAGASIPLAHLHIVGTRDIADALDAITATEPGGVVCACAGLGGALERVPAPCRGVVLFLYGEIVDVGSGPQLGNLMASSWAP